MEAVSGVSALYRNPANVMGLHEFKARFEGRMLEMVGDVDENVTVQAVSALLVDEDSRVGAFWRWGGIVGQNVTMYAA